MSKITDAPERIFILSSDSGLDERYFTEALEHDLICDVNGLNIEYVRKDIYDKLEKELADLKAERDELQNELVEVKK